MATCDFHALCQRTLGGAAIFSGVNEELLLELSRRASWRTCEPGDRLLAFGERCEVFYVLVRGTVAIAFDDGTPTEQAEATTHLGLYTAFRAAPSRAQIVASSTILVAAVARCDLLDAMARAPTLVRNVGRILAVRGARRPPRAELDGRILTALARATRMPRGGAGLLPVDGRIDLVLWATLLGVDTIDVERAFARLERAGIVKWQAHGRALVDVERLRRRLP